MKREIRRQWLTLGFIAMFAGVGTLLLVMSHAATPLEPSVAWTTKGSELVNINSGLCLGIPQTTKAANGTLLVLTTCNSSSNNQKWTLTWGSGTIKNTTVVNGYSQCLDDIHGSTTAGSNIQLYTCNGVAASQTWSTGYGDGTIRIHSLCLGVSGNAKTAGTSVILSNCNLPTPTVSITSPGNGATVSGQSTTISATARVSSGSIQSLVLAINGSAIATCTSTTSCSHTWNTTSVSNGTYTLTATATSSGGVSAQASEPIKVNNPVSPSPPPPSPGGSGQGSSTPPTNDTSNWSDGNGGSFGGVNTSGSTDTLSGSDTSGADANGSTTISSGDTNTTSTDNGSNATSQSPSQAIKTNSSTTALKAVGAVFGTLVILVVAVFLAFFVIKRRQTAFTPTPQVEIQNLPVYPQEDSATSAARLNWWLPDDERQRLASQQQQPTIHSQAPMTSPTADEPPDMFAEGRKRLQEEEQRRQSGGY